MVNSVLKLLPQQEIQELRGVLDPAILRPRQGVYETDQPVDYVYFLDAGLVSLMVIGRNGDAVEAGLVGADGILGVPAAFGQRRSGVQAVVQIAGSAQRLSAAAFLQAYRHCPTLQRLVNEEMSFQMSEAQQNAFCNALHSIEARLCRWILHASDVARTNSLELTQEFISNVLAVQRTSVSVAAHSLQISGLIRCSRGRIELADRVGLEKAACECYGALAWSRERRVEPANALQDVGRFR